MELAVRGRRSRPRRPPTRSGGRAQGPRRPRASTGRERQRLEAIPGRGRIQRGPAALVVFAPPTSSGPWLDEVRALRAPALRPHVRVVIAVDAVHDPAAQAPSWRRWILPAAVERHRGAQRAELERVGRALAQPIPLRGRHHRPRERAGARAMAGISAEPARSGGPRDRAEPSIPVGRAWPSAARRARKRATIHGLGLEPPRRRPWLRSGVGVSPPSSAALLAACSELEARPARASARAAVAASARSSLIAQRRVVPRFAHPQCRRGEPRWSVPSSALRIATHPDRADVRHDRQRRPCGPARRGGRRFAVFELLARSRSRSRSCFIPHRARRDQSALLLGRLDHRTRLGPDLALPLHGRHGHGVSGSC